MNDWTQLSIEYANQRSYLDDLFHIYPTIPDWIREIDEDTWVSVEKYYHEKNNDALLQELLKLELFPIKDSYISYLRQDKSSLDRNPRTVNRICWRLYDMSLGDIYEKCSQPKETNRQIWPMFSRWLDSWALWILPSSLDEFTSSNNDAILKATDKEKMDFAKTHLNYNRDKGLDFVGRFNNKYVIWEAKFLSATWWSQNSDFEDAIATLESKNVKAITVAILDGILYIPNKWKMYKYITDPYKNDNIMSALVFRDFLYQI